MRDRESLTEQSKFCTVHTPRNRFGFLLLTQYLSLKGIVVHLYLRLLVLTTAHTKISSVGIMNFFWLHTYDKFTWLSCMSFQLSFTVEFISIKHKQYFNFNSKECQIQSPTPLTWSSHTLLKNSKATRSYFTITFTLH